MNIFFFTAFAILIILLGMKLDEARKEDLIEYNDQREQQEGYRKKYKLPENSEVVCIANTAYLKLCITCGRSVIQPLLINATPITCEELNEQSLVSKDE